MRIERTFKLKLWPEKEVDKEKIRKIYKIIKGWGVECVLYESDYMHLQAYPRTAMQVGFVDKEFQVAIYEATPMTKQITVTAEQAAEIMDGLVKVVAKMDQPPEGVLLGSHWEDDHVHFVPGGIIDLPYSKHATVEVFTPETYDTGGQQPWGDFIEDIREVPVCTAIVTDVWVCQVQDVTAEEWVSNAPNYAHVLDAIFQYKRDYPGAWERNEYVELVTLERRGDASHQEQGAPKCALACDPVE